MGCKCCKSYEKMSQKKARTTLIEVVNPSVWRRRDSTVDKALASPEEPNRRGGETFESEEEDDSSQPAGSQHRTADERWLQRSLTRTQFHKLNTTAAPSQEKERESTGRAREQPTDTTLSAEASRRTAEGGSNGNSLTGG